MNIAGAAALLRAGQGRLLPCLLLIVAALALQHIDRTPLAALQASQFDRYQRLQPRDRPDEPVLIVGIDSPSLVAHGQWPWPRDLLARLIDRIQAGDPLAVGLDIVFAEPDALGPTALRQRLPASAAPALAALNDPDRTLANSLAGTTGVLATIGLAAATPGARLPGHPLPRFTPDPNADARLPHFAHALSSRPELQQAARGEGFINGTPDALESHAERGILRRVPSLAFIDDAPYLSLPLEMVRQALGGSAPVIERNAFGMQAIRIGDYHLPTQPNGEILLHFGKASGNYYLSASDVLAGRHAPEIFSQRFVIIGLNSPGLQDRIITPLGDSLPGIDIHAQVIESLLLQSALHRPYWMPWLEMSTLLACGLLLIAAVPALRPKYAVFAFAGISSVLLASAYLAFLAGRWLFDAQSQLLLLAPVFMSLLAATLLAADAQRRQAETQLQQSREAAARVAGELDAARRIQMGLLPDPTKCFAGETRFTLAALLEPALAVGGDYYDCFMLDARHLCLAIGDVSGKGLPASLFMAIAKTLSSTLMRRHDDLGAAMCDIEIELSRENPASLFVTAFIGVLDCDDGRLDYVCAGHDAPLIVRNAQVGHIDTEQIAGPPLCALGDFPYAAGRMQLQPGDLLCLFTDGVSEARHDDEFFGSARLQSALQAHHELPVDELCPVLRTCVRDFEAGQPAADDLTLLALRWHGPGLSAR